MLDSSFVQLFYDLGIVFPNLLFLLKHSKPHVVCLLPSLPLPPCGGMKSKIGGLKGKDQVEVRTVC